MQPATITPSLQSHKTGGLGMEGIFSCSKDLCPPRHPTFDFQQPRAHTCKPAPKSAKKSQQTGKQIGGPIFRQNRLPVTWISVPGPKHTFLLVAQLLESCGNPNYVSIFKKNFVSRSVHGP